MAKTSMVNREAKRAKLAKQHGAKRDALKKIISSQDASYEEKMAASSTVIMKMFGRSFLSGRAEVDAAEATRSVPTPTPPGRPRAVYSKFGLGRNALRKATMNGDVPGLRKASW